MAEDAVVRRVESPPTAYCNQTEVTAAMLDERSTELVTAAARAWVAYVDAPSMPGRHSGATDLYSALRALFAVVFPRSKDTDEALRRLIRRARKKNVTSSAQERVRASGGRV